jgi:predicted membrane channel-forming protein YqfA (hemolysin III family)
VYSKAYVYLWYTYAFEYNQVPWKQVKDNVRDLTWVMIRVVVAASAVVLLLVVVVSALAVIVAEVVVVVVVVIIVVVVVMLYDLHC